MSKISSNVQIYQKESQICPKVSKLVKSKIWANVIYEWPYREVKNLVKNKTYIITFCPVDCEMSEWRLSHFCPDCWGGDTNLNRSQASTSNINNRIYFLSNMYMHYVPEGGNEAFEASEVSWPNFKSQGLRIIRTKFWNASGSGSPPCLIPILWIIGILLHKLHKDMQHRSVYAAW